MKALALAVILMALSGVAFAQTTGSVDLLWQANTYTPTWYRGHSVATAESTIKVVALPHIKVGSGEAASKDLVFKWQKDGRDVNTIAGVGNNILTYVAGPAGSGNTVTVSVSSQSGTLLAANRLTIPVAEPKIVLYEEDPLAGSTYWQALSTSTPLTKPELSVRAEPYFFSRPAVASGKLNYEWLLNGQKIVTDAGDQTLLTFAVPAGGAGENTVELTISNLVNVLQSAKAKLVLKFNQSAFTF